MQDPHQILVQALQRPMRRHEHGDAERRRGNEGGETGLAGDSEPRDLVLQLRYELPGRFPQREKQLQT
jgi:hypothetical protein